MLLADEATAEALETDLLRYGVDLLDLYRGTLSYRRVCALVTNLPDDAAVWRQFDTTGVRTRAEVLLASIERRMTVLWATVAVALGHEVSEDQLAGPLDAWSGPATTASRSPATTPDATPPKSLRDIAIWMRDS